MTARRLHFYDLVTKNRSVMSTRRRHKEYASDKHDRHLSSTRNRRIKSVLFSVRSSYTTVFTGKEDMNAIWEETVLTITTVVMTTRKKYKMSGGGRLICRRKCRQTDIIKSRLFARPATSHLTEECLKGGSCFQQDT